MKFETALIYHKVIDTIASKESLPIEIAKAIVDNNETWLIDMVEAMDVTNISYLAECIFDFHCDEVNN